ncbi:hypothetical protein E2C01_068518 [Portunus trituberculatus]|uniref:Uncharacterized protein n=1 Tax=Portunus trituberculatus TaxID=210409 RepID=A0A5B7HZN1_PORTR|nr:hypothetical protein [Portunus trituberculatus]
MPMFFVRVCSLPSPRTSTETPSTCTASPCHHASLAHCTANPPLPYLRDGEQRTRSGMSEPGMTLEELGADIT